MLPCDGCAYRVAIPGDAHISCSFLWETKPDEETPLTHKVSPRVERWYLFPFNYDPLWGPDTCAACSDTADPEKRRPKNPLFDLISILGPRF